jgi:hypothetical protein
MLTPTISLHDNLTQHESSDSYSRLQHLVGALRGKHDPERTLVATLTGYFDASGAPDQGTVLVVGGFMSFESRWIQLEPRWNKALRKEGIKCFHMSDLINGKKEFEGWKTKPDKQRRLLMALIQILKETVVCSFGSIVVLDDWEKTNREYALAENDFQPYSLAGWSTVQRALRWCKTNGYRVPPPLFIFEHGDKHQDAMIRRVEKDFGVIIRTALKKPDKKNPNELPVVQLQSADFVAWQMLNLMRGVKDKYAIRSEVKAALEPWLWEVFKDTLTPVRNWYTRFTLDSIRMREPTLLRLCREYGVPRRAP